MPNLISRVDIVDEDFVDAYELASDGYTVYRYAVSLVSTTAATKTVVVNSSEQKLKQPVDYPLQSGDIVKISGNAADGYYTVNYIIDDYSFKVNESIVNSVLGNANFIYPSGASRIGINSTNFVHSTSTNLEQVIRDIDRETDFNRMLLEIDGSLIYIGDGDILLKV